jgi:hypothetical protein
VLDDIAFIRSPRVPAVRLAPRLTNPYLCDVRQSRAPLVARQFGLGRARMKKGHAGR